jgi:hypothetical protein
MAWLKQAVAAGYRDATHMRKDNDLESLRGRDDFNKLIAELERVQTKSLPHLLGQQPRRLSLRYHPTSNSTAAASPFH